MISEEGAPDARWPHTAGLCISAEVWGWHVKALHSTLQTMVNQMLSGVSRGHVMSTQTATTYWF